MLSVAHVLFQDGYLFRELVSVLFMMTLSLEVRANQKDVLFDYCVTRLHCFALLLSPSTVTIAEVVEGEALSCRKD